MSMTRSVSLIYFLTVLICSCLSWNAPRSVLRSRSALRQTTCFTRSSTIQMTSTDNAGGDEKKNEAPRTTSRPPIIPFDFARDDIMPPKVVEKVASKAMDSYGRDNDNDSEAVIPSRSKSNKWVEDADLKTAVRSANNDKRSKWVEDPSRPTGYGNVDEDDDDWVPSQDSEGVEKFLKDYFFNSPYDSPKRKDAKFVIRNVTLISGILGTVFTILFYAFPGKFISYRGTADFSQRYSSDFIDKDPGELLNDKVNEDLVRSVEIGGESYFDDAVGLPPRDDSRVAYPVKPSEARAPGRTENL